MVFLVTIGVLSIGLLLSLSVANRSRQRKAAAHRLSAQRSELVRLANSSLRLVPTDTLTGRRQGRVLDYALQRSGGLGAEAEYDLKLRLSLRHPLPPDTQIWRRGQPGPEEPAGERMPGIERLMMRTSRTEALTRLVAHPGLSEALGDFFGHHPTAVITDGRIHLQCRSRDGMPRLLLQAAETLAASLEVAIEAPWIAMAHRLSLTPHTEGPLAMVGERSGLPLSVDMIGPGAATITVSTDLSPGAIIRRRERGQTGGTRTGNPIADQLLVVSEGLAEALRDPDLTAAAMAAIHGHPGSRVDERGVLLVVSDFTLRDLPELLDTALDLGVLLRARKQPSESERQENISQNKKPSLQES